MVNSTLMEQIDRLSTAELIELRDAIQAELDDVPPGQWALLEQRAAAADANPDYITLGEWSARRNRLRTT